MRPLLTLLVLVLAAAVSPVAAVASRAAAAPAAGPAAAAANLVADPGFELQTSREISPPWRGEGSGPKGIDIDLGYAHSGGNNAYIRTGDTSWNAVVQTITVVPHTRYRLTGWIRTSGNVTSGYFGVRPGNGNATWYAEIRYAQRTSYTPLTVDFETGPNTTMTVFAGYWAPGADSWVQVDDVSVTATSTGTVRNWLRSDFADPWIFRHNGSYYGLATRGNRISMVRAASVADLGSASEHIVWTDSTPSRCCNMWAPEAHYIGGRWYIYYAADDGNDANHRMYVLESTGSDPLGPYRFVQQLKPTPDVWAIDGTILRHGNSLYLVYSGWPSSTGGQQNLYIVPMTTPTSTISGARTLLSTPTYAWERSGMPVNEGPVVLQRGGKTYLFYSASGCWTPDYTLGMLTLTGDNPVDPDAWTKSPEPVFSRSDANGVYGPGHNSFFSSPDGSETWLAYHATANSSGSCGPDRSLRIQKVDFAADGTPRLGTPVATYQTLAVPSGDPGPSGAPAPDGTYMITPEHVYKALDVAGCSTAEGADVIIWPYWGGDCQKWRLRHLGDRRYTITAVNSGRALTVAGCSATNGADVVVEAYRGDACQQWYVERVGPGDLRISAVHSGRALDVGGCSAADGADVITWPYWGGGCQQWNLRAV